MRNGLGITATLIAALIGGPAQSAALETPALAPGWQALLGCWEPVATARDAAPDSTRAHLVCIVPVNGTTAVDMVTVVDGKVVARERVDASGARLPLTRDDCSGWQSAEWSSAGQRVYLRSELTCEGGLTRTSTGVLSMPTPTEWIDVQSVAVGERRAVRALRYREARASVARPLEVTEALGSRPFSTSTARLAAAMPVSPADLIDVSRHLDAAAIEVWLVEQGLGFRANAQQLEQLANRGVATSVIDMVVALSYPERFSVAATPQPRDERSGRGFDARRGVASFGGYDPFWDPYYGSRYNRRYYSPYGYSQYGYDYGYGSGWYPNTSPVIIVVGEPQPGTGATRAGPAGGKVVNGRGYTRRPDPTPAPDVERLRPQPGSSGSGSSGAPAGSAGSAGSSGSSGSSGEERTAKRRPPPTASN